VFGLYKETTTNAYFNACRLKLVWYVLSSLETIEMLS
jgi:hypothetical protein